MEDQIFLILKKMFNISVNDEAIKPLIILS